MSDGAEASRASLIAPEAETKWYEGAGIFEAAAGAHEGIRDGDYLAGGGNALVVGLSALGAILDPFQSVFAAGVGWLMEHLDCLREPLDSLAGDPKEIEGHAATWRNVQERTNQVADLYADEVLTTTAAWGSEAASAYRMKASESVEAHLALGEVAAGLAEATLIAGSIVGVVRNTVRDLIAEVVGAAISKALQALLVVTIPKILAEVALMVAEYTGRILQVLRRLTDAIDALGSKIGALSEVTSFITRRMDGIIADSTYTSLFLNSSKLHAADSYIADSDGALAAYKHAYRTLAEGDAVVYGTKARIAVDALREGFKMNSIQNGGATAQTLNDEQQPAPKIDLPL